MPKSKDYQTQKGLPPLDARSVTSVMTGWPRFMKLTEIMKTHLTHVRSRGFLRTCHISGIFKKVSHLDNGTWVFFPGKASMMKPAKQAGPGYALPFSRHIVGKRYPCPSCTTEAKHPVAAYQQEVLRCYQLGPSPTVPIVNTFWLIHKKDKRYIHTCFHQ